MDPSLNIEQTIVRDNIEQIPVDPSLNNSIDIINESEKAVHVEPIECRRSTRRGRPVVGTRLIDQIEPV